MAIVSKHLSSSLRFKNMTDEPFQTLQRVRPNLNTTQVTNLKDGITAISQIPAMSAALTITEELADE